MADGAPDAQAAEYGFYNDISRGQQAGNYGYDEASNLISDAAEGITGINRAAYGKIRSITRSRGTAATFYVLPLVVVSRYDNIDLKP